MGRDVELERLLAALDQVVAGQGRLVLVSGEPGIGKTRLVEELAAVAMDQGAVAAWGRVDDGAGAPAYWPWVQVLEAVLEECGGEALGPGAGPIAAIVPAVKELVAEIEPPPALDAGAARFRLHEAIVELLGRMSADRRLVLVLEDMHWADVASLELTRFLAARLTRAPVLMVVTYRSVDAGSSEGFDDVLGSLARIRGLERVALTGLSEAEVGRFMAQTIGVRPRPGMAAAVHARTEGNPFFVGELALLLRSEGLLTAGAGAPDVVPVGVRDVIRRRLLRLPQKTNELLVLGAVIGRDFDVSTLAAVAQLAEGVTLDLIEPAVGAGVIAEVRGAEQQVTVPHFRFSHALIRDTVYRELSASRRATLHARVGTSLEQLPASPARLTELAAHFFLAAPIVGPEPGLGYALEAAAAARASWAYEQAEFDLRRALSLVDRIAPGRPRWERELHVQNRLAGLLLMTKGQGSAEFGQACARARELCQLTGENDDLFNALFGLALFHVTNGEYRLLAELGAQFLAVGNRRGSTAWLVAGHFCAGSSEFHAGALAAAQETFAAAVRLARSFDLSSPVTELFGEHPLAIALPTWATIVWLLGDDRHAAALSHEAVALARTLAHPLTLADVLYATNKLAVLAGDPAGALSSAEEALALCQQHGFGILQAWLRTHRGWALCHLGHCDQGIAEMTAGMAANRAGGGRMNTTFFLGLLADGEALRGDRERALELVDEALVLTGAGEEKLYQADLYRRRGELLAARGDEYRPHAVESLRQAISVAQAQGAVAFTGRAEAALARLGPAPNPTAAAVPAVPAGEGSALSPRERELVALVGRGLTDKEIAAALTISLATVRSHLDRVRDKTGRRRRAELTRLALDLGLV